MNLFEKIGRRVRKSRSKSIYLLEHKKSLLNANYGKGVVTIFHDYERQYHSEDVSEYSDYGVQELLRIEKKFAIKATYNVVAKLIDQIDPIIKSIISDGHEIASHSYCHYIYNKMDKKALIDDISNTMQVFNNKNLKLSGIRCPQSRWCFKQLPIMAKFGIEWSAENDYAPFPYTIYRNKKRQITRFPIKMDDWGYEENDISPEVMKNNLIDCVNIIARNKSYGAIGFHPWVQGKSNHRIKVFEEFIEFLANNKKIDIIPFTRALNIFRDQ